MGESDFVEEILAPSGEHYERHYDFVRRGFDLDRIVSRVAEILEMQANKILSKGRRKNEVVARSLLCFQPVRELGFSPTQSARDLEMTGAGFVYAVRGGEKIASHNGYDLLKSVFLVFQGRPPLNGVPP